MAGLTWQDLDAMVEGDPLILRDRAWAEIESLRKRNHAQGEQLAALLIATSAPHIAPLHATGGTCDWGGCDGKTTALRWSPDLTSWLPVCEHHEETL